MTHSYLAVGISGAVELVPLIIFGLHGSAGYGVDVLTFLVSLIFLSRVGSVPAHEKARKPSLRGLLEGLRYALFPFWAVCLGAPRALGLLYASGTVGAIAVTLTSKWMASYRFHGRTIIWAAIGWGGAIACAGLAHSLILVLIFLALAGASVTSLSFSVTSGGIICIPAIIILALFLPKLHKYDAETDAHAIQERKSWKLQN